MTDDPAIPLIWVIDDDADVAAHLELILRRAGVEATMCSFEDHETLRQAIVAGGRSPDLVLVDQVLPTGSGSTLVPEIRAVHPSSTIRFITAAPDEVDHEDRRVGVVEKPPTAAVILELLRS